MVSRPVFSSPIVKPLIYRKHFDSFGETVRLTDIIHSRLIFSLNQNCLVISCSSQVYSVHGMFDWRNCSVTCDMKDVEYLESNIWHV